MRRGRFGLGAVTGVLLGLLVIASNGLLSPVANPMVPYSRANFGNVGEYLTASTTATTVSSTSTVGVSPPRSSNNSSYFTSNNSGNSSSAVVAGLTFAQSSANPPFSQIREVISQPGPLTGLVLLPIVLACVLGLVVYRLSAKRNRIEDQTVVTE